MKRTLPPLNGLRAFEAAARHMSFTDAADELSVTQAAISQPALPTSFSMSALTMNMPEPIIDPATTMVASSKLREGLKAVFSSIIMIICWNLDCQVSRSTKKPAVKRD